MAFGLFAQNVDGFEFAFRFEVPIGPAVAGGFALHDCAEAMDGRLIAVVDERAVGFDFRAEFAAMVKQLGSGFQNSKLDDGAKWHARLGALPALLAGTHNLVKGIRLERSLRRAGVRVHRGVTPLQI